MSVRARQRDHVLATVDAATQPVDAAHIAEALDIHVSTARFHLNKLIEAGLIEAVALPAMTVGRPRTGYSSAVPKPEIRLIGLFVETLGDDEQQRVAAAVEIGRRWAAPVADAPQSDLPDPVTVVESTLTKLGFQVRSAASVFGQHELSICSCPLRDITRTDPAVSRAIVEGALRQALSASPALDGHYDVSVAPDPAGTDCTIALRLTPAR
ncbi:MAG: ArsR family transcriptional regulator [Gordonia sp. (in: high G+C Gram-positive bacteria)]|uniref:helix-turn-helix domain-containing protein n=1 Tax=Gordonia sp. (in: high G+C Gram-positive bacteria) TaxID=84139 RepID=UPI0039E3B1F5